MLIKDLELTLKIIPKMQKYSAFGTPKKDGEHVLVDGVWLTQVLTELKARRES